MNMMNFDWTDCAALLVALLCTALFVGGILFMFVYAVIALYKIDRYVAIIFLMVLGILSIE